MIKAMLLSMMFLMPGYVFAGVSWELKVVLPSKEKKTYAIGDDMFTLPIELSGWKCFVEKTDKDKSEHKFHGRAYGCLSTKDKSQLKTIVACKGEKSDKRLASMLVWDSSGQKYIINLTCES